MPCPPDSPVRPSPGPDRRHVLLASALLPLLQLPGCGTPKLMGYRVVNVFEHDPRAYTQGLLFHDGHLYESTGQYYSSTVRRVKLETGEVELELPLPGRQFGEGLALHGDELFQLTWYAGIAYVRDLETLRVKRQIEYEGEGWGITSDGEHLIQSDGSNLLQFRDPSSFEVVRWLRVTSEGRPLNELNELEYVDGQIWANLWKYDQIARIDPATGEVVGWIDLSGLFDASDIPDEDAVLNGIAWDAKARRLFVTGKLWPKLFEIELVAR